MDSTQSLAYDQKSDATELWAAMHVGYEETHASRLANVERLLTAGHSANEEWDHERWNEERSLGGCVLTSYATEELHNRSSPLSSAVVSGHLDLIKLFIRFGADVRIHTQAGLTLLHLAVILNRTDMIDLLCDSGADIEARIQDNTYPRSLAGFTPLHLAVVTLQCDATRALLCRGADLFAETKCGWTSRQIAVLGRHANIITTLLDYQLSQGEASSPPFSQRQQFPTRASDVPQHLRHDCKDTELQKAAQDLIRQGEKAKGSRCKRLLDKYISEALTSIQTDGLAHSDAERGTLILQEIERLLLETAGISDFVSWPQNFCVQCQKFQFEANRSDLREFEHSSDLETLKKTASHGCPLCQIFVAVLKASPGRLYNTRDHDGSDSAIRLQITFDNDGGGTINVTGSQMRGSIDLKRVDDHMNTIICTTDPSDQGGNGFRRGLMLTKACLEVCHSKHTCQSQETPKLPTRVIDVGDERTAPSLYCSDGQHERYVALSYCWGETDHYKTTKQNLDTHISSILFENLPKTIQDAVIITRDLKIRYLWVDAICIMQDSYEDFVSEVSHMGDIYARATLTIAAKDSKSCSEGCLPRSSHPCPTILPLNIRMTINFRYPSSILVYGYQPWPLASQAMAVPKLYSSWLSEKESILETRGWTFQEDLLSPRVLHCRDEAVVWSCLEHVCYEGDFDARLFKEKEATKLKSAIIKQFDNQGCPLDEQKLLELWFQIVADYSVRLLSHQDDKLRAVAALQRRFGGLLNDTPVLGMWRSRHFVRSLLWTCCPNSAPKAHSQEVNSSHAQQIGVCLSRCPSWSWASISNPVTYTPFGSTDADLTPELVSWNLSIIEADIDVKGSITLCSELFHVDKVTSYHRQQNDLLRFNVYLAAFMAWTKGDEAKVLVNGNLDIKRTVTGEGPNPSVNMLLFKDANFAVDLEEFWFILMYTIPFTPPPKYGYPLEPNGTPPRAVVMCLEKISENDLHFRRIGLAMVYKPEEWRQYATKEDIKMF